MAIRAVVFDLGGVLERSGPPTWFDAWSARQGAALGSLDDVWRRFDPDGVSMVGGRTEDQMRRHFRMAFGLSESDTDRLMTDLWDWYCGELDRELFDWAVSLRSRARTAILSNSADGARREEEARYALSSHFDPIVYSHEVGLAKPDPRVYDLVVSRVGVAPGEMVFIDDVAENVEAASAAGIVGILHTDSTASIAAVERLLAASDGPPQITT